MYTITIILVSVKGDKDMKTYITLTALSNYIDIKELAVGKELILEEDKKPIWWWSYQGNGCQPQQERLCS